MPLSSEDWPLYGRENIDGTPRQLTDIAPLEQTLKSLIFYSKYLIDYTLQRGDQWQYNTER